MDTLKKASLTLLLAGALSIGGMALPGDAYAHCEQGFEDCKEECEDVFDGDGWFAETGRSTCKGGCHIGKLLCDLDLI